MYPASIAKPHGNGSLTSADGVATIKSSGSPVGFKIGEWAMGLDGELIAKYWLLAGVGGVGVAVVSFILVLG